MISQDLKVDACDGKARARPGVGQWLQRFVHGRAGNTAQARGSKQLAELGRTLGATGIVLATCLLWVSVRPEFFWQDDFQTQYLPASREIARALSEGEWPIFSARCWLGAALGGEYQHGVFSLSTLAVTWLVWKLGLSLTETATTLMLYHSAILAAGAFQLARRRALTPPHATLVALIAALNGWMVSWGIAWYPAIPSFAWLTWTWWALERALEQRTPGAVFVAGVCVYLTLTAGWPITVVMAGVLSACLVVHCWLREGRLNAAWPALLAWCFGVGLAAPALALLLEYAADAPRVGGASGLDPQWVLPWSALDGLILPAARASWRVYGGARQPHASVELAGGLVPVAALVCAAAGWGLSALRRQRARARSVPSTRSTQRAGERSRFGNAHFELSIALLALACAALPSVRPLQSSFRWLPLFHLALALAGACALDAFRRGSGAEAPSGWRARRRSLAVPACAGALVVLVGTCTRGLDPTTRSSDLASSTAVIALAWMALELLPGQRKLRAWAPVLATISVLSATYSRLPPSPDPPRWSISDELARPAPYDRNIRYLSLYAFNGIIQRARTFDGSHVAIGMGEQLRLANLPMYTDLQFVNGYSALRSLGFAKVLHFGIHGEMEPAHARWLLLNDSSEGGLLDLMATDGLVISDQLDLLIPQVEAQGWRKVASVRMGTVLHRDASPSRRVRALQEATRFRTPAEIVHYVGARSGGVAPLALLAGPGQQPGREWFAPAEVSLIREERRRSIARVAVPAGARPALVTFARPWLPGWRSTLNGRELPVEPLDLLLPAIRVPPGARGELVLEYRPPALRWGLWIAGATAVLAVLWALRRRTRTGDP